MFPLISIIMPAYNNSQYVVASLSSLTSQTYKNLEIVFINDGSTDDTLSKAATLLEQSNVNFKIIDLPSNKGVSAARNIGINEASGEFITFLDSDDYLSENLIEALYNAASQNSQTADITICGYRRVEESTRQETTYTINKKITSSCAPDAIAKKIILNELPHALSALCRKDVLQTNRISFMENCRAGEDGEFFIKVFSVSKKTAICYETGYYYVQHDTMSSRNQDNETRKERYRQHTEAQSRTADFIIERCRSRLLLNVARSLIKPTVTLRRLSYLAMTEDKEAFCRAWRETNFRRLFKSREYITKKPEVFIRALLLYAFPGVYYEHYAKRYK